MVLNPRVCLSSDCRGSLKLMSKDCDTHTGAEIRLRVYQTPRKASELESVKDTVTLYTHLWPPSRTPAFHAVLASLRPLHLLPQDRSF